MAHRRIPLAALRIGMHVTKIDRRWCYRYDYPGLRTRMRQDNVQSYEKVRAAIRIAARRSD